MTAPPSMKVDLISWE